MPRLPLRLHPAGYCAAWTFVPPAEGTVHAWVQEESSGRAGVTVVVSTRVVRCSGREGAVKDYLSPALAVERSAVTQVDP